MNDEGKLVLVVGVLLAAGLAASLAAGRLRMPGLVLVLALGMVIGSDGLSLIDFGDFELARQIGVVALAFILFEGGLSAGFEEIRPVLRASILLATLGTLGTAGLTAVVAGLLFDLGRWRRSCSAPRWRPRTPPRCSPCCAARRCAAGSPARWRASRASTTRSRSCS